MRWPFVSLALVAAVCCAAAVSAQQSKEANLPLDGWIEEDASAVHLTWNDTQRAHRGAVDVSRRIHGEVGAETWTPITVIDQPGLRVTDTMVQPGTAYEYRVIRRSMDGDVIDVGHWLTGRDVPAQLNRGQAHIVLDASIAGDISSHVDRFIQDLTGDGWEVIQYSMPPHSESSVPDNLMAIGAIKGRLRTAYEAAPDLRHAIVLVGHVPLVLSGIAAPDGHDRVPHPTDLIYGDVDGRWRVLPEGVMADNELPSDSIEMQVGRIDFRGVSDSDPAKEIALLRAYFDKNHNWRHGRLGDLRAAYGQGTSLITETHGLRNIVGPTEVTTGGHHDVGEAQPWLWGVDFGDYAGQDYPTLYANKAVFTINFGSYKQRFDLPHNPMTALLAQPWYTLAVGWGARPSWWPHHMALGGSIGDVHMRTVNNARRSAPFPMSIDYLPTGEYQWRTPIWVNLLGDPTLRGFPLGPPAGVQATARGNNVVVEWSASTDSDTIGYHVYRQEQDGTFRQISGDTPLTVLNYTETTDEQGGVYMVRAVGLKTVHAGSFFTASQGVFAREGDGALMAPGLALSAQPAVPVPIDVAPPSQIFGFVAGPEQGQLMRDGGGWIYTAPTGFQGQIVLAYVMWDGMQTADGTLTITVDQ